jgi:hypothetical protein
MKDTHFKLSKDDYPVCGIMSKYAKDNAAYDPRHVDCLRCRRTKIWKSKIGRA